jgi:heat shock protein HtpX
VGTEPSRAALVVTRGLLDLLHPRELHGVIAHELSHIANLDTRVGTTLAAVLATVRMPIALLHWGLHPAIAVVAAVLSTLMLVLSTLGMLSMAVETAYALWVLPEARQVLSALDVRDVLPIALVFGYGLLFCSTPSYLLLGGHLLGRLIGGHVSREREFLADADAVMLTRDPEALALALVKIEAAQGASLSTSATASHLFIVTPARAKRPWWDAPIRSHPPVADRVDILARMGPGISPELLRRAAEEAAAPRAPVSPRVATPRPIGPAAPAAPLSDFASETPAPSFSSGDPSPAVRLSPGMASFARALHATSLLADARSDATIRGRIAPGEIIALLGLEGAFLLVRTAGGDTGYVTDTTKLSWELS